MMERLLIGALIAIVALGGSYGLGRYHERRDTRADAARLAKRSDSRWFSETVRASDCAAASACARASAASARVSRRSW
jgi:hypothetical protein